MVSVNGSWQRRGHSSHIGIVSAVTGKVLDIEVMRNYCKECVLWIPEEQHTPEYLSWKATHICNLNHDGSVGSVEPKDATHLFRR